MLVLYLVIQLTSLEQLYTNVNGVLRLEDFVKFHEVLVVDAAHDLDFVDQGLLAFFLAVCALFGEGFYSVFLTVLVLYDEVDRGKVSLADFFDGFEEFMESSLVELFA